MAGAGSWRIFPARHQGRALAGIMVLRFAGRATYLFGASAREGRNLMPAYLLHWQAIQEMRNLGDTDYDLWGIPPDHRPGHPLAGPWQVKSGLNARIVAYPPPLHLPLPPT